MNRRAFLKALHERSPGFREALRADTRVTLAFRGERSDLRSRWDFLAQTGRLMWQSDAFLGHVLYRSKVAMLKRGIPVLPRVAHGLAMMSSQICIGDPVVVAPGVYIPHGQVVVDGITEIGPNVILAPWVTVGLRAGNFQGPVLESGVHVGTGAKIIGPVRVGEGTRVGANAVVVDDVPGGSTVVGVPGRVVERGADAGIDDASRLAWDGSGPDVRPRVTADAALAAAVARADIPAATDRARALAADDMDGQRLRRAVRIAAFAHAGGRGRGDWPPATRPRFSDAYEVPEVDASELDPDLLATGLLRHGALILRGLVPGASADRLREDTDRVFAARDRFESGTPTPADGWYERWPSGGVATGRVFVEQDRSGVLTVDSPRLSDELIALYESTGVVSAVQGYFGERPALSCQKWTLRRVPPDANTGWHQDGAFLGKGIRAVNLWLALTDCGIDAPGLDIVPFRLDRIVETGTDDSYFDWDVGSAVVDRTTGGRPPVHPQFRAGDAIVFDEMLLHRTGVTPGMTKTRYAVEAWFFAPSHFPPKYEGILL